jgi:glycosyltransferase involved in cell wall biosynthesis
MSAPHILVANVFFAPFSYGGATVVAEQVAHALVDNHGYRVTAVSMCCRYDLAPYVVVKSEQNGITNYLINVPASRSYGELYDNPNVTSRLAELIATLQPDLVHAHCIQDMGTGILTAAATHDVPVILSIHDFWWICDRQFMIKVDQQYCGQSPVRIEQCKGCVDNFWAAKMRFDHVRQIAQKAAHITYPSNFALDLCEASGLAPGSGVVWENGVHHAKQDFFQRQAKRREKDSRLSFGFVGGPSQIKGWPLIKRAFSEVDTEDFRVVLVDGSLDGTWWKDHTFDDLPGDWEVHPRFSQEKMDDFYAEIDVLLFMSQWKETFGLAIREALARGIAVIQTDSGGTTEHGAISPDKLIPIGAPASQLKTQVKEAIDGHPRAQTVHSVASFDDQAREFDAIIRDVLANVKR